MNCKYTGCNAPESECSGACLTAKATDIYTHPEPVTPVDVGVESDEQLALRIAGTDELTGDAIIEFALLFHAEKMRQLAGKSFEDRYGGQPSSEHDESMWVVAQDVFYTGFAAGAGSQPDRITQLEAEVKEWKLLAENGVSNLKAASEVVKGLSAKLEAAKDALIFYSKARVTNFTPGATSSNCDDGIFARKALAKINEVLLK